MHSSPVTIQHSDRARITRSFGPSVDSLLDESDLRAWLDAVVPLLRADGFGVDPTRAEVVPARSRSDRYAAHVTHLPPRLKLWLPLLSPEWMRSRTSQLVLDGSGTCAIVRSREKGTNALDASMNQRFPRWRLPPQGKMTFTTYLRETNGWEGESWTFHLPISAAPALEALSVGAPEAPGTDARTSPFSPASLRTFGHWRVRFGFMPEWRADMLCATSRAGYAAAHGWAGPAESALVDLVDLARARGLLRWKEHTLDPQGGLSMQKGRVQLEAPIETSEDGSPRRSVLVHVGLF